jgi:hypothetical protein
MSFDRYGQPYSPGSVMSFTTTEQGWQCPVCKHVMSPVMTVCPYCPPVEFATTAHAGEPLPLPDQWQAEACAGANGRSAVKVTHVPTGAWAEALDTTTAFGYLVRDLVHAGKITIGGPSEDSATDPLTIRLPESMDEEARRLGRDWREVFPGLQAKVDEMYREPETTVTVVFRPTPKDGM